MALNSDSAKRKDLKAAPCAMQHRHFATVATILRDLRGVYLEGERVDDEAVDLLAAHFADKLRATNPQFNRERFIAACKAEG